jgi:arylsulfatase A-like enzyme
MVAGITWGWLRGREFGLVGAVATLELLLARVTGGPQSGPVVASAVALAAVAVLALRGATRLGPRAGALATALPVVAIGLSMLIPPFVGFPLWWPLAVLGAAAVATAAWRAGGLGPRVGALWTAAFPAAAWVLVAVAGLGAPSPTRAAGALAAVAVVVVAGRAAPLLIPLALLPTWPAPGWSEHARAAPELPDVLLISVDTLRLDRGSEMASARALARRGRAYAAQAPSPWTLPSLGTLLSGLEPQRHAAGRIEQGITHLPDRIDTLAERLGRMGYDTAASVHSPYALPMFGLRQGFARFRAEYVDYWVVPGVPYSNRARPLAVRLAEAIGCPLGPRVYADARVADARALAAARRERPLLLWVHFLDAHIPYRHAGALDAPRSERAWLATLWRASLQPLPEPAALDALRRGYSHEVDVIDRAIAELLEALPEGPHGRIVVLTSDHGEEFGEHGGWEHGHSFYQELLAVPLVIAGIEGLAPGDAGLVDVVPTLLAALGRPASGLDGRALQRSSVSPYRASNPLYGPLGGRSVKRGTRKLIDDGESLRRFDLAHDPGERAGLPAAADDLRHELPPRRLPAEAPLSLDRETRAGLRALGYLQVSED